MKPILLAIAFFTAGLAHAETTKILATCRGTEFTPNKLYAGFLNQMPGTKMLKSGTCGTKVSLVSSDRQIDGSDFFSLEMNNDELLHQVSRSGSKTLTDYFASIQRETNGACEFLLPTQFQSILTGPPLEKYLKISNKLPPGVEVKGSTADGP